MPIFGNLVLVFGECPKGAFDHKQWFFRRSILKDPLHASYAPSEHDEFKTPQSNSTGDISFGMPRLVCTCDG